jgi:hypothetical protein
LDYVGIVSQQQQPETGRPQTERAETERPQTERAPIERPATRHRPPRFSAFLSTGAVLGLLVGFLLSALAPADARYDAAATWGFLGLVCAGLGLLLAGVVAVLIDRRS